jgi:phytoene synthase
MRRMTRGTCRAAPRNASLRLGLVNARSVRKTVAVASASVASESSLAASFAACCRITRRHARSFYFASRALPAAKREAAYAVYAFCRHADDLLDERAGGTDAGRERFERHLDDLLRRLYDGTETALAFAPAFTATVRRFDIPMKPFRELVHGVCLDEQPIRIPDFAALHHYCYHVASVVGLIMARIFELRDPAAERHAIELGVAMQLTNILRDVREDWEKGRVYLPADELARFGVREADLAAHRVHAPFIALMKFQIERAREFYRRSEAGIPMLADDGSQFTVWLMRTIYAAILDEIERQGYDVFARRARVSLGRKLRLYWQARRSHRAQRRAGNAPGLPR